MNRAPRISFEFRETRVRKFQQLYRAARAFGTRIVAELDAIRKLSAFWDRSCYFFLSSAASTTDGRKLNCSLRLATSRARSSMRPASALRLVKRKRFAYSFRVQKFAT